MSYGFGQRLVVARQAVQLGPGFNIDAAKAWLRDLRRHAVRFWKDDVEPDRDRTKLGDLGNQIRNRGTRPRPLPDHLQARLIDVDDDDRPNLFRPRPKHLEEVKSPGA